jgi:hypothetical protein
MAAARPDAVVLAAARVGGEQLLDAGAAGRLDDVRLDHQVVVQEIGRVGGVGQDPADAGGGMVGSAVVRRLAGEGCEVLTADRRTVDLTRQAETAPGRRSRGHGAPSRRRGPATWSRGPSRASRAPWSGRRYVLATGETTLVRDFVTAAFAEAGIGLEWAGRGVEETADPGLREGGGHEVAHQGRLAGRQHVVVGLVLLQHQPHAVTRAVAAIRHGQQDTLYLGNLDARRDWGHAREYANRMPFEACIP